MKATEKRKPAVSKVLSVERVQYTSPTYDVTVEGTHNYFAGHGRPALVHNCKHFLVQEIVGPVTKRVQIDQLKPKVSIQVCDYVKTRSKFSGPAGFVYACRFLSRHEKRNEEILEWLLKDIAKGHSIVIPLMFKEHVWEMVKRINDLAGKEVAEGFVGGGTKKNKDGREAIIERARNGKTKVVVGIRSIVQLGINVPLWSCLYYVMPMSNEPNWKQESSRILTPMENKRQPLIRMFVDPQIGLSLGCFYNTYKQSIAFGYEPTETAEQRADELFKLRESGNEDEYDVDASEEESDSKYKNKGLGSVRK